MTMQPRQVGDTVLSTSTAPSLRSEDPSPLERAYMHLLEANKWIAEHVKQKREGTLRLEMDGDRIWVHFRHYNLRVSRTVGFTQLEMNHLNPLLHMLEDVQKQAAWAMSDAGRRAAKARTKSMVKRRS